MDAMYIYLQCYSEKHYIIQYNLTFLEYFCNLGIFDLFTLLGICCFLLQSGKIQIFDIGAGMLLESIEAHSGAVWSISMAPDKVNC